MRAISLWQPYAWAIFEGLKRHETRGFAPPAKVRGQRIAIHVAQRCPLPDQEVDSFMKGAVGNSWRKVLPRGAFMGTVVVQGYAGTQVTETNDLDRMFGDFTPGRYAWRLKDPLLLPQPIPAKGMQGWWEVDEKELGL